MRRDEMRLDETREGERGRSYLGVSGLAESVVVGPQALVVASLPAVLEEEVASQLVPRQNLKRRGGEGKEKERRGRRRRRRRRRMGKKRRRRREREKEKERKKRRRRAKRRRSSYKCHARAGARPTL